MGRLALGVAAILAGSVMADGGRGTPPALVALPLRAHTLASGARRLAATSSPTTTTPAYPLAGSARDQGVFTVPLSLGTPPQVLNAIVDTGSTLTAFTCADCAPGECGTGHGVFDPDASTTAARLACADPACECGDPACGCGPDRQCIYRRTYAESSSTAGLLVTDGLALPPGLGREGEGEGGGRGAGNATAAASARIAFGCALKETGSIHNQPAAGIVGLGAAGVGLVDQLVAAGVLGGAAFSLCLATPPDKDAGAAGGALLLGPGLPAGLADATPVTTPLVRGEASFYTIKLAAMSLGRDSAGSPLPLATDPPQPGVWAGGMGVVLDSGTTYTYLPTPAFTAFKAAVGLAASGLGGTRTAGPDPAFPDVCWGGLNSAGGAWAGAAFPDLILTLAPPSLGVTPPTLSLPPRNYLFPHPNTPGAACLGVFDNGDAGTILGGITFLETLVQLDRGGSGGGGAATDGVVRFYRGVDCAGLGAAAAVGMRAAGEATEAPPAPDAPRPRRSWTEVSVAAASLAALGTALALLCHCRQRNAVPPDAVAEAGGSTAPVGDARWWKWPNFAGASPALPARWWWMPDFRGEAASAAGPGRAAPPAGRPGEAREGEGHADMARGLAAPVGSGGIVVRPVGGGEEVELGVRSGPSK